MKPSLAGHNTPLWFYAEISLKCVEEHPLHLLQNLQINSEDCVLEP